MLPPLATWLLFDALMVGLTGAAPMRDVVPFSQVLGVMLCVAGVRTLPVARRTATGLRRLVARTVAACTLALGALHLAGGVSALEVPFTALHVSAAALATASALYAWRTSPTLRR